MKNLVIFDLETTGVDRTKDQIIQFAAIKVNPETNTVLDSKNMYIRPQGKFEITIQAYCKHGITAKFLEDKPYFADVAKEIYDFFEDADLITYNGNNFDIPFLITEFAKVGLEFDVMSRNCYDTFVEERRRNGIKLVDTYKRYKGKSMEEAGLNAHDALSDVKATYTVFYAQQKNKPYGPEKILTLDSVITMQLWNDKEEVPCFNIGKYRTMSVEFVASFDQNYIKWCANDSNFLPSTKEYIRKFLK